MLKLLLGGASHGIKQCKEAGGFLDTVYETPASIGPALDETSCEILLYLTKMPILSQTGERYSLFFS